MLWAATTKEFAGAADNTSRLYNLDLQGRLWDQPPLQFLFVGTIKYRTAPTVPFLIKKIQICKFKSDRNIYTYMIHKAIISTADSQEDIYIYIYNSQEHYIQ